jgi:hypothetical protein
MTYKAKKERERRELIESQLAISYEDQLDCLWRIDIRHSWVKRPGRRKELEDFAITLSYSESSNPEEAEWQPVKRYDCKHYRVEKHEFWISRRARRVHEWEEKPLDEVLELAKQDLVKHYIEYIAKVRQKGRP